MAFGNIATFHLPIAASAGASQWGTDVRKLLSAADATADTTTITSHGTTTGSPVVRTDDPYTTSSADSDQSLYGWAITPSDMNSVAGALRFFPAGDHVATVRMGSNSLVSANGTLSIYAYRVASAASSRTRTLLDTASAAVTLPGGSGQVTAVVTLTLPEVVFQADETIQYSFEFAVPGVVISGRNVNLHTGTSTVECRIDTPGLKTLAETTGSAAGTGTGSGVTGKVLGMSGSADGSAVAAGSMSSRADTTGTAAGVGTATGSVSSVAGTIGDATGSGSALGVATAVGSMVGSAAGTGSGTGVLGAIGGMVGASSGVGAAAGVLGATSGTVGSASGLASVDGLGSSVAGTIGSATGVGAATGLTSIVLGTTGTVEIGAPSSDVPDWPVVTPTRQVAGVVYHHETAAVVVGATVRMYRDVDHLLVQVDTSSGVGAYSFTRDADDPYTYFVTADYDDAGTPIQGKSTTAAPTTI